MRVSNHKINQKSASVNISRYQIHGAYHINRGKFVKILAMEREIPGVNKKQIIPNFNKMRLRRGNIIRKILSGKSTFDKIEQGQYWCRNAKI